MARMIIGLRYDIEKNNNDSHVFRNCFIELLNGPNFDVDNLDYIVRDTQMSGIQNVTVDIDRLFNSLCIVTKTIYQDISIESEFPISKKETIVEGGNEDQKALKVKGNFAGSISIQPQTKITISNGSYFSSLTGKSNGSVKISMALNEFAQFESYTEIEIDSEKINVMPVSDSNQEIKKIYPQNNRNSFYCKIKNAKILTDFTFTTEEEATLTFQNECTIQICGAFQVVSSISVHHVEIFGNSHIDKVVILDKKENTNNGFAKNKRIEYAIGFRKQAINIIANVLEARNYLYLWIYAHHKVVYYANFLIPVLAKELFKFDLDSKIWELEYNSLKYLDDCYFWTMIKEVNYKQNKILSINDKSQTEISQLIQELMERKYKCSLYKSLAEFDLFFEQITDEQMNKMICRLNDNTNQHMPHLVNQYRNEQKKNKYIVGYVENQFINQINKKCQKFQLKNLIYVYAEYKMKTLKTENIYINMGDKVVTMADIHLLEKQSKVNENNENYFYFYYEIEETETVDRELEKIYKIELSEIIRKTLTEESIDIKG